MTSHISICSDDPIEEIVLDDSENSKEEEEVITTKNSKTPTSKIECISLLKKNINLRGLLPPERDKSYIEFLKLPDIKRCCIEHNYFIRIRISRLNSARYNFRNLPASGSNTLQFENKKPAKQPTVDAECLVSKLNPLKDSFSKNNVNAKKKRRSVSVSVSSGSNSPVDDLNDRDYCPENSSSDTESVASCDSVKEITKTSGISKNDTIDVDKKIWSVLNKKNSRTVSNKICRFNDYFPKIKDMQKLLKTKCVSDRGKSGKVPLPRLKKMMGLKKSDNILKMPEYLFPMPDLTKINEGEKNWKVKYMDDEVQNLGLDDLLLKASELNAENFTKALGRKLEPIKANFNSKDSSEIVFTIPKAKKGTEDGCESDGDHSKRSNIKTIKLDISKPFFESDKPKEQEPAKPVEEASPKRTGIKVKTVENINEEFKDSLGRLKDKELSSDKNNFGVSIKETEGENNYQEDPGKDPEGGRPFIMTIIQSKAEKQRPAILRNSYLKKKSRNLEKGLSRDRSGEKTTECRIDGDIPSRGSLGETEKNEDGLDIQTLNSKILEKGLNFSRNSCGDGFVSYPNVFDEMESEKTQEGEGRFTVKKRNIPFILNHSRKIRQIELPPVNKTPSKLAKVNEGTDKPPQSEKTFKITSIEQKLGPKETNRRFIKVVPYEPINKPGYQAKAAAEFQQKLSDEEPDSPQKDGKSNYILSLTAFSAILKEILPEKWFLCLDKKYGLQIIKTHVDEFLNPTILMSVVIGRCGKLTVNVRGKQLSKSHELFSNLCGMSNSENKLSLNYVLAILNKLRHRSVCFGCDDPSLKKYWSDEGVVENQTESQQVYRSHLCQLLVSLGKRRCYPCYRMNESLKKRYRRDKQEENPKDDSKELKGTTGEVQQVEQTPKTHLQPRGVKRNLEDFLEESFSTMKQQIVDEIEKNKKVGERENALKTQEEILSFMGLTRKECLDNPVRKSKRKKNSFYKLQPPVKKKTDQKELEFLEKYWTDINTLFSTSLLFGAYSRTGRSRLRENCRMFQKLLSTWKNIVKSNPEWFGEVSIPDELTDGDNSTNKEASVDQFEKMDVPALRAYNIKSVKEVNRIKHKLRTRNSYFKVLYNKFVKRRMKRPKTLGTNSESKESGSSATSTTNTPTLTEISSDENSRDKEKITSEESQAFGDVIMSCVSDAD